MRFDSFSGLWLQDAQTNWAFDIFGFAEATPGYSLSLLYCHLLNQSGIQDEFPTMQIPTVVKYARRIEQGYNACNPYHNRFGSPCLRVHLCR